MYASTSSHIAHRWPAWKKMKRDFLHWQFFDEIGYVCFSEAIGHNVFSPSIMLYNMTMTKVPALVLQIYGQEKTTTTTIITRVLAITKGYGVRATTIKVRIKRFCSMAVLWVSFTWEIVKTHVIRLRVIQCLNARDKLHSVHSFHT